MVKANKVYGNYVGGLITEAGPLNFPEGASKDELNCLPTNKNSRRRRLGIDYENNYSVTNFNIPDTSFRDNAVSDFTWKAVNNDGDINFLVIQISNTLYFYDLSTVPLSDGIKAFTINLFSFKIDGATNIGNASVVMDSGEGYLFVSGEKIKPFYVKYTESTDTIVATEISIQIRDFEGLNDGLEPTEEPSVLSTEHHYNLKNQGWNSSGTGISNPITSYHTSKSKYPPNNKQWWTAKDTSDNFDPTKLTKLDAGNTLAPKGHFIVEALRVDRSSVSGVTGIDIVKSEVGPSAVAFFASRVWYVLKNRLYYTQIIEREEQIGKCYQEQDPTAETLSELVDTDGGTVLIPDMGRGSSMFVSGNSLIIFANNGVWSVSGSIGSGFKPSDFSIDRISDVGITSQQSLIDVEGTPIWWTKNGIYTITRSETTDRLVATSLTENTIQDYYDNTVPEISKYYAAGTFDSLNRQVLWLWKSAEETVYRHKYDMVLVLDVVTGGFYPLKFSDLASNSPYVSGVFETEAVASSVQTQDVETLAGDPIVTSGLDQVVADVETLTAGLSQTKYLVIKPQGDNTSEFTFGSLSNTSYFDWVSVDGTGVTYSSYVDTGYLVEGDAFNKKQTAYVVTYMEKEADSSCKMQVKWDYSNSGNSGKWSRSREIYRNENTYKDVIQTRSKVRGHGRALQFRFESVSGKPFTLAGWAVQYMVTEDA